MAPSKFTEATLFYTTRGKVQSKKIPLPQKRHALGILKQREGYVEISWFVVDPRIGGYDSDNFKTRRVPVPQDAGLASLKVGGRVISKAT